MKNRPRTCLGCRNKFNKDSLLKVVRITNDDGAKMVIYDAKVKLQGRGAWVCRKKECIDKVKKSRAFERTLKARVMESIYEELSCII